MKIVRALPLLVSLVLIALASFGATAFAAGQVADPESSLLDLVKPVYDALSGGHYAYAGALLVILLVALTKRYLGDRIAWFHSDAGGSLLALLASSAAALGSGLASPGAVITLSLLKSALLVGVGAAGGYAMIKNLIVEPLLKPLAAKAPAWMQPIFAMVFWIFDKPSAIVTATKAGDTAVAAHPSIGVAGVTGEPMDVK